MAGNKPLQERAGRNIGIEPSSGVFLQSSGSNEVVVNTKLNSKTVAVSCPEGVRRTPNVAEDYGGIVFNNTNSSFYYQTYFRDSLGNEVPMSTNVNEVPSKDTGEFMVSGVLETLVLCPGEAIVIKAVEEPA